MPLVHVLISTKLVWDAERVPLVRLTDLSSSSSSSSGTVLESIMLNYEIY